MPPSYEIECPNYKTGCDIENCPRFLDDVDVKLGESGELVGSGFCTAKGGRYFSGISHEKIKVLAGESTKMNEGREKISQMSEPMEKRTALLLDLLTSKLKNAPDKDAAAALAAWETAEAAIILYDARKEVVENRKKRLGGLFFSQFLLNVIDTYFAIIDAAEFYAGTRQIDIHDTPAVRMAAKGCFINEIDSAKKSTANMIRGYLDSGFDNRLIEIAFGSLDSLLRSLCQANEEEPFIKWKEFGGFFYQFANTATDEEMFGPNPAPDIDDFKEELERISLLFKNLQTSLRLREHRVYDLHPEWEVTDFLGGDPDDPQDGREYRRNCSTALHAYYEQYRNQLEGFEEMTNLLSCHCKFGKPTLASSVNNDLRPFLASVKSVDLNGIMDESEPWDFSVELKKLLSTPVNIEIDLPTCACAKYDECTANLHLNPWIAAAKKKMYDAFTSYCRKREAELPDGITKELLKQKAAELISSRKDGITAMDIVHKPLIEEWIERKNDAALGVDDYVVQRSLSNDYPTEEVIVKKLITEIRKQPINARLVDVAPSARKPLRAAMKDPGGRPKKKSSGTKIATQGETAISFGAPCTESKIANWEAYERTNGQRGSRPFGFITKDGERIIYSAELRLNPTPDNQKRLTALIAEFQSRHRIKEAIGEKALHMKSPETLAKASGQAASAIRKRSQLKYEK